MATLKQRLYHTIPPGDTDTTIGVHALYAACRLFAGGHVTSEQVKIAFAISDAEWTALKDVVTAKTAPMLNDVLRLTEEGYLTPAQADTLLGL